MTTGGKMISLKELPVGYRFNPSDKVLVNYHLKRKLSNIEEEYCIIPEFDIYKLPPWDLITKFNDLSDLASDGQECFFYHRWNDPSSKRHNRRTKDGFWKDTGGDQKLQVTDQTKWLKKILVYRHIKRKSAVKTEWAMHEYQDISNPAIVVCRIHKSKPKNLKARVDSGSYRAWSDGSFRATAPSKTQTEPPEVSPETLVNTAMESQSLTDTDIPEYHTSLPKQTQVDSERSLSHSEDTYSNCLHLTDLKDPLSHQILMREQPPFSKNVFINGCDQENGNWSYLPHVTTEDGGNMVVVYETPNNQPSNYELPGFVSPPQHPQKMPTEEISPIITNSELDIHGWGAQLPVVSLTRGAQETYFKETQDFATEPPAAALSSDINSVFDSFFAYPLQYTSNSQTPIPPLNPYLQSPGDMRMLPSSDSSGGGNQSACHFDESFEPEQTNLEVTRGFANESSAATQSSNINSLLDSFSASPLPPTSNTQALDPPPNSYLPFPKEMQMLPNLSSVFNMHTSSDSSDGGNPIAFCFGESHESQQTNLQVTQDLVIPDATQSSEINALLDSFSASPLPPTSNSQALIPPPNSYLPFPEEMQMLPNLSSVCNMHTSSDSSDGGNPTAFRFGESHESQQTNFQITQDVVLPDVTNALLDSFSASPLPPTSNSQALIPPPNSYLPFPEETQMLPNLSSVTQDLVLPNASQSSELNALLDSFSTSLLPPTSNSQALIPPPNSYLPFPEEMHILPNLSSVCNMHTSSDSSDGGNPTAFCFGESHESQQANLQVTQDLVLPDVTQSSEINALLYSFSASPLSPTSNSQALIPPLNSSLPFPEEMQMLPNLSSVCNMHASSDSSDGGNPTAFRLGESHESQRTNLQVTQDLVLPDATQSSEINALLDSFSISPLPPTSNSQALIPPPNSYFPFPEEMRILPNLSSVCNMHTSSDSSDGGNPIAFCFGESRESQQTNLQVTQDLVLPDATQSSEINALLDSFSASPLPPTSNSQALIPPPNSYLPFPEEMQILPNLSSVCNMHTSSDGSDGGNPTAFCFGESYEFQQANLQVTQDLVLPDVTQSSEINSLLDSFTASPLPPTSNSQVLIPPPNCHLLSPEAMQKLWELSSICNIHPTAVSSGGGSTNAIHFGECHESQQTNFEVTQDFATESSVAAEYVDIDSLLDSLSASPELPEAETEESSPCSSSIAPGGYGAEYHGVPDASGGPVRTKQP